MQNSLLSFYYICWMELNCIKSKLLSFLFSGGEKGGGEGNQEGCFVFF